MIVREPLRVAVEVDDFDKAIVVADEWMLDERDLAAVRREAEIAEPKRRLVEAMAASAAGNGGVSSRGASSRRIAEIVSAVVSRANGVRPVSISCITMAKLKMSLRASARSPRTCSGDM